MGPVFWAKGCSRVSISLCPRSHRASKGRLQATLPFPKDIFRVLKLPGGDQNPVPPRWLLLLTCRQGSYSALRPDPSPLHPVQLCGGSAASPQRQPRPIMWLLMKSRPWQSDDIAP